jgi:hypothetical protein
LIGHSPRRRRRILLGLAAAFLLMPVGACRKQDTPEQRLRTLLARAEQAVEAKQLAAVRALISARYHDDQGHDRRALESLLWLYLRRHEAIHLYTRISDLQVASSGAAQVVLFAAMTARPAANAEALVELKADLLRFELVFEQEQDAWRLLRASWRRAEPADFLW